MPLRPWIPVCAVALACQPAPATSPVVAVATASSSGEALPPPSASGAPPLLPASAYLTRDYGCAKLEVSVAEDLLKRGNEAIARAGEHPTNADLDEILPLLHHAAYGGYPPAQRRFGGYVVGYWYTDEMFWPRSEAIATAALAMLRVAALHELATTGAAPEDPMLRALAGPYADFSAPDSPPAMPDEWLQKAGEEAKQWSECVAGG